MNIFILLGGLIGLDGYFTSSGMIALARQLRAKFPKAKITYTTWTSWQTVAQQIEQVPSANKVVLIGYSGGGSRATWVQNQARRPIDLLITYDPSPQSSMSAVTCKAINYYNRAPFFFGLGGGMLKGPHVTTVPISEQHLNVQFDQRLHEITITEIGKLV